MRSMRSTSAVILDVSSPMSLDTETRVSQPGGRTSWMGAAAAGGAVFVGDWAWAWTAIAGPLTLVAGRSCSALTAFSVDTSSSGDDYDDYEPEYYDYGDEEDYTEEDNEEEEQQVSSFFLEIFELKICSNEHDECQKVK